MVFSVSPVGRTSPINMTSSKADLGLTRQRTIEAFQQKEVWLFHRYVDVISLKAIKQTLGEPL